MLAYEDLHIIMLVRHDYFWRSYCPFPLRIWYLKKLQHNSQRFKGSSSNFACLLNTLWSITSLWQWFYLGTPVSSTYKNWSPRYSWNIVESSVKYHNP